MTLTTLVVLEIVRVQMVRSQYQLSLFSNPFVILALASSLILQLFVIYTPFLQKIFRTVSLSLTEWGVILSIAVMVWFVGRLIDRLFQKHFFRNIKRT